jgi:hypothetical protein
VDIDLTRNRGLWGTALADPDDEEVLTEKIVLIFDVQPNCNVGARNTELGGIDSQDTLVLNRTFGRALRIRKILQS